MNDMTYRPIEHLRTTNHPKIRFPKRRMASVPLIILFISVTTLLISVPLATMVFFMSDRHINHAVRRHTVEKVVKDAAEMKEEPTTFRRGIVMSCPFGPSHTNRGSWKPSNMMRGVDAVLRHLKNVNSSLPLFLGYYASERNHAQKWCEDAVKIYDGMVDIACYEIPEDYPKGLYGYAKIFAIRHAPLQQLLWLDCDVFPIRPLDILFDDEEFQKTGAMFWPDSRDYFDESAVPSVLNTPKARALFPTDAWYVRQGFDSGMILLNRNSCAEEIEAICSIARSSRNAALRRLSMGDKDIFHIVWMIHEKNFTLVPYIGETGNVQTHVRGGTRRIRGSHRLVPGRIGWRLSSQAKYGRDGQIYALHQLHRQPQRALIATLSSAQLFYSPKTTLSTQFVKPLITARKDLRFLKGIPSKQARGSGDFVAEVEGSLIRPGKRIPRTAFTHAEHHLALPDGLLFKRSEEWILRAAQEINNAWYPSFDTDAAALKIYQDYRKTLLVAKQNGKLSKDIYRRLWRRRDALRPNAQR